MRRLEENFHPLDDKRSSFMSFMCMECTSLSPAQSRGYKYQVESDNDTGEPSQGVYLVLGVLFPTACLVPNLRRFKLQYLGSQQEKRGLLAFFDRDLGTMVESLVYVCVVYIYILCTALLYHGEVCLFWCWFLMLGSYDTML